jgi:Peptidase family M50.
MIAVWWIEPETYNYTYNFAITNLALGLTNLMPCYPLDGGRILVAMLSDKYGHKKGFYIAEKLNVIISIILFTMFIFTAIFQSINLSLGFFAIFTAICGTQYIREMAYQPIKFKDIFFKLTEKGAETNF